MVRRLRVRRARGWTKTCQPQASNYEDIRIVITQPATEMPEDGYPVVFFGHGVGNNKEQSFPVATELAGKGIATVSMDWVAQGERAVKTASSVARL